MGLDERVYYNIKVEELSSLNYENNPSTTFFSSLRAAIAQHTYTMPSSCCCQFCRFHISRPLVPKPSHDLARLRLVKRSKQQAALIWYIYLWKWCFLCIWPQTFIWEHYKQFCTDSIENASLKRVSFLLMYMVVIQIVVFSLC